MTTSLQPDIAAAADAYVRFWQSLPAGLDAIGTVMTRDVRFRDPFHDVQGIDRVRAVFDSAYRPIREIGVEVTDRAFSGPVCYLRWSFSFRVGRGAGRPWRIEGMSEIHFTADGRATLHIDHWDAAGQFYERLPVIGWLLRSIRRRIG